MLLLPCPQGAHLPHPAICGSTSSRVCPLVCTLSLTLLPFWVSHGLTQLQHQVIFHLFLHVNTPPDGDKTTMAPIFKVGAQILQSPSTTPAACILPVPSTCLFSPMLGCCLASFLTHNTYMPLASTCNLGWRFLRRFSTSLLTRLTSQVTQGSRKAIGQS